MTHLWPTSLVSGCSKDHDVHVMSRRVTAVILTLAPLLSGCTSAHQLAPRAQDPAAQITLPSGSDLKCPRHSTVGADAHPVVPLTPINAQRLAPSQPPTQ